ncbi:cation transport protein-domain-containing protein [Xylariales sp. PMI_506]|nr:cation transport protein-domain-containing protein [Xylariales sp. PMI_506]
MRRIRRVFGKINAGRRRLIRLNFYRCHLAYFVVTIIVSSAVLYGANPTSADGVGDARMSYIDAFFLAASTMTTTGLNTINLNAMTGYQQSVLFVLMLLGDLSVVSISVVVVRRWVFQKRLLQKVKQSAAARMVVKEIDEEAALRQHSAHQHDSNQDDSRSSTRDIRGPERPERAVYARTSPTQPHQQSLGGLSAPWETGPWRWLSSRVSGWLNRNRLTPDHHQYLSFVPHLDDRGRFRKLTPTECAELGGVEYRALTALTWILPTYTAFWVLVPMVILAPYAARYDPVSSVVRTSQPGDLDPGWWGVFIALSSYTNTGLDPLNASMVPFRSNWLILIVTGSAILAGNTFYPIFLRCYIWILWMVTPKSSELYHSLSFLLHHPRRCYLWLFDRKTTLVLAATQAVLIFAEWVLFEILNIRQTALWELPAGTRAMDGLYQSLGTRSVGYYIVTISSVAPALQIIYLIVMYFSAFPILVSLRNTNVYEERSLGLGAEEYRDNEESREKQRMGGQVGALTGLHIRNQLAYDLWWIALSWFLICIIEEPQLNTSAPGYNNFSILFEVVSAYGNCGLSLGVPYDTYSLSGSFHTLSKLILVTVMLRGRHRILPLAIDRSIMIPGEAMMAALDREYLGSIDDDSALLQQIRDAERGDRSEDQEEAATEPENSQGP